MNTPQASPADSATSLAATVSACAIGRCPMFMCRTPRFSSAVASNLRSPSRNPTIALSNDFRAASFSPARAKHMARVPSTAACCRIPAGGLVQRGQRPRQITDPGVLVCRSDQHPTTHLAVVTSGCVQAPHRALAQFLRNGGTPDISGCPGAPEQNIDVRHHVSPGRSPAFPGWSIRHPISVTGEARASPPGYGSRDQNRRSGAIPVAQNLTVPIRRRSGRSRHTRP